MLKCYNVQLTKSYLYIPNASNLLLVGLAYTGLSAATALNS